MNSKAIKRQLLAAIAMVLVAALALGSSTFAWFANNNKVTADGLTVNAQAEGNMLIIADTVTNLYSGDKAHKTAVTLGLSGTNLKPVHPVLGNNTKIEAWNHAYSDSFFDAVTATGSNEVALDGINDASGIGLIGGGPTAGNYYLKGSIAIGLDDANTAATASNLRVSAVNIGWASGVQSSDQKDIINSARVMLVDSSGVVKGVYSNGKVRTAVGANQNGTFGAEGFTAAVADTMTAITSTGDQYNSPKLVESLSAGSSNAQQYTVYVFFDGRDGDCTSQKFTSSGITVALEFVTD